MSSPGGTLDLLGKRSADARPDTLPFPVTDIYELADFENSAAPMQSKKDRFTGNVTPAAFLRTHKLGDMLISGSDQRAMHSPAHPSPAWPTGTVRRDRKLPCTGKTTRSMCHW